MGAGSSPTWSQKRAADRAGDGELRGERLVLTGTQLPIPTDGQVLAAGTAVLEDG